MASISPLNKVTTHSIKKRKQNYWNWLEKSSSQGKTYLSNESLKLHWNLETSSIGDMKKHMIHLKCIPEEHQGSTVLNVWFNKSVQIYCDKGSTPSCVLWALLELPHISLSKKASLASSSSLSSSTSFLWRIGCSEKLMQFSKLVKLISGKAWI